MVVNENLSLDPVWNKPVKEYDRALDPLGMNRVTDKFMNELLSGITSLTLRARYYSFYLWAIEQIRTRKWADNYREFRNAMYNLERLFMLSCVAHEENQGKESNHNSITGSDKGTKIWKQSDDDIRLNFPFFGNSLGGYGQYYRGALKRLELIEMDDDDPYEKTTKIGKKIADAFDESAERCDFRKLHGAQYASKRRLLEIGQEVCLCRLPDTSHEKNLLKDLLFGFTEVVNVNDAVRRRNSLSLILNLVQQVSASKIRITDENFLDACYFRQVSDGNEILNISVPLFLDETCKHWKLLRAHDYLSLSSEAFLTCFLEFLSNALGGTLDDFINTILEPEMVEKFSKITNLDSHNLLSRPLRDITDQLANNLGIKRFMERSPESSSEFDTSVNIRSQISEFSIAKVLDNAITSKRINRHDVFASSSALTLCIYMRFLWMHHNHPELWSKLIRYTEHNLSPARFVAELDVKLKQETFTLRDYIQWFTNEYVVRPANDVYKQKLIASPFSKPKSFFHKEGSYYKADREYLAGHRNIRFESAINILRDLGLLNISENVIELTKEGMEMLKRVEASQ